MTLGPSILLLISVGLITYSVARHDRRVPSSPAVRRARARLAWDLFIGLVVVIGFALYIIAPQQVRPRIRKRILPRPEIPTRRIFKSTFPVRYR